MDLTQNFKNRPWDTENELNYDSQPNFEFQYHYNSIIINAVCCFCLIYTVNYFWLFSCKVEHWNIIMKINFIIFTLMNPKISEIMKQCCKFVKNHFCFLWCLDFNYELASKSETRLFIHNNPHRRMEFSYETAIAIFLHTFCLKMSTLVWSLIPNDTKKLSWKIKKIVKNRQK